MSGMGNAVLIQNTRCSALVLGNASLRAKLAAQPPLDCMATSNNAAGSASCSDFGGAERKRSARFRLEPGGQPVGGCRSGSAEIQRRISAWAWNSTSARSREPLC